MKNNPTEEIQDKLTKVCVCKAISRAKIKDAIRTGALTLDEVQKLTGAGTCGCKGFRCNEPITKLIEEFKNKQWS